jgi:hypothetical protein
LFTTAISNGGSSQPPFQMVVAMLPPFQIAASVQFCKIFTELYIFEKNEKK